MVDAAGVTLWSKATWPLPNSTQADTTQRTCLRALAPSSSRYCIAAFDEAGETETGRTTFGARLVILAVLPALEQDHGIGIERTDILEGSRSTLTTACVHSSEDLRISRRWQYARIFSINDLADFVVPDALSHRSVGGKSYAVA